MAILCLMLLLGGCQAVAAQPFESLTAFRIFLKDGRAIPSYGQYAVLGDRIVFVLPIGAPPASELQLVSIPTSAIDMNRTAAYADGVRARTYAATRGPSEYSELTVQVAEILASIESEPDVKRQLALAEDARNRLRAWPNAHYGYRAAEIRELIAMFDDAIGDMSRSTGPGGLSVAFTSGPVVPSYEPALPAPSARESIELAMAAAAASDRSADRLTILRRILANATAASAEDLRLEIARRIDEELAADRAYARLGQELLARAERALRRADVAALASLRTTLSDRDQALGAKRPEAIEALASQLGVLLERARAYRLALDHWTAVRAVMRRYELSVRAVLTRLDGLRPVLTAIRDQSGPEFGRLERARAALGAMTRDLQRVNPPDDAQVAHSTLFSALFVARDACDRRREAVIGRNATKAADAAAAAAGALILADQARADLIAQLLRPKLQ